MRCRRSKASDYTFGPDGFIHLGRLVLGVLAQRLVIVVLIDMNMRNG